MPTFGQHRMSRSQRGAKVLSAVSKHRVRYGVAAALLSLFAAAVLVPTVAGASPGNWQWWRPGSHSSANTVGFGGHPRPHPHPTPTRTTATPTPTPSSPSPTPTTASSSPTKSTTPAPTSTTPKPTPTPTPTLTTPAPPANGFPSTSTTGVPAGTALTNSGSLTVTTAGTVINALNINGTLDINASNVTIQNTRITGSNFAIIRIKFGVTGVKIINVEVNGKGVSGAEGSIGIYGPANIYNSNIYGVENGIVPDSGAVIMGNYIHDLGAPGAPHYDGIQMDGGLSNITVTGNTVLNSFGQTSAVMIDNYFGSISNISVTNNLLGGGGYTVYSDGQFNNGSITGVVFANNRMIKGQWGYDLIRGSSASFTGNVDNVTSQPVS